MRIQDFIILGFVLFSMLYLSWHLGRDYGDQAEAEELIQHYNSGYRSGMLYSYDNIVICGASPEEEGIHLAKLMRSLGELDLEQEISCGE